MRLNKTAFTLAEALVTLMIIGIIAAMTIPSMREFSDESRYVAAAKKAQATVYAAVEILETEHGELIWWPWDNNAEVIKRFKSSLKTLPEFVGDSYNILNLTGGPWESVNEESWFQTTDGMIWTMVKGEGENIAEIYVDTNGETNPNRIAIDVVGFAITKDGIVPKTDGDWVCLHHLFKYGKMPWIEKDFACSLTE